MWDEMFAPHTQRINMHEVYNSFNINKLNEILELCNYSSIRWVNVPINLKNGNVKELFSFAYNVLKFSGRTFINLIGVENGVINSGIFNEYASLIYDVGKLDHTGINNFRLGLSFNIGYDCPFFPFTRSSGKENVFTIALEMVEDINSALKAYKCRDLTKIRNRIIEAVDTQIRNIYRIAKTIEKRSGIKFGGFDFSLAPVISDMGSIVSIFNSLGIYNFGHAGTMFATSFITDILKGFAEKYPSVGFSGVMFSLLEDLELCAINNGRGITVEQLTMLSTMCGCGLDMVPVSGDITKEEIHSLCLDIAGISCKYKKPLGIRLLPIPGVKRNQVGYTSISGDADFIANTRVVPLDVNIVPNMIKKFKFMRY